MSVERDPFRDAKEGSCLVREAAPPHYQEVLRRATFIIAECESAIRDSFITRDKLKALLGLSMELNKVRLGCELVSGSGEAPGELGNRTPIIVPLERGTGT